jgi:hypothetical protein
MDFGFVLAEDADVFDVAVGPLIAREALPNQLQRGTQIRAALDELHPLVVGGVTADRRLEDPLDLVLGRATIGASRRGAADPERPGVGGRVCDGVGGKVNDSSQM